MTDSQRFRALVFSVVKHDYIARAVAAHPRFDLVAVADDPQQPDWVHQRNQEFAERFGIPYLTDFSRACREQKPDVAIVSSQAERHCELAVQAVQAGLHVIVDKPLSTRLSECDSLVQAVQSQGTRCLIWNRNLLPAVSQTRDLVGSGAIGRLRAVHCDFYFSKDAGPPKGSRAPGDPAINWLQRQIEAHADGSDGGVGNQPMGELQNEGIYPLAYLRLLTDQRIQRVFARTTAHFHQANVDNHVEDLATVTLEMDRGLVGSLCIGRIGAASHPELGEIKMHLLGTDGALVISEARPEIAVYYRGQDPKEFKHIRVADDNNFRLVEDFAVAIDTGGPTLLDATAGRDICAVVQACLRSAESGIVEQV
jgi:predicted dehydrogenase